MIIENSLLDFGPLVWSSKNHMKFSLLTTENEYHCAINYGTKVVYILKLLGELGFLVESLTIIHCYNQSAIQVVDNLVAHNKMKHVEIHYH